MEARLIRRPVIDLFTGRTQCLLAGNTSGKRHESSYRRTKKLQNIKPEESFLFTNNSPQQDHIIFNPPSSVPSVLHTPLKFLPKEDKRRAILLAQSKARENGELRLPPVIEERKPGYQRHHLSEEDVAEIRRLRNENPDEWTRYKVAKKYNCSQIFVAMITEATPQQKKYEEEKAAAARARYGPKKRAAMEDRRKRREEAYLGDN